ncbi:zf-HC2 domain-containing protein [Oscillibacter sp.]|uniref:zf-HC2 domain-containing protein n=1 Tax=Oscillibacter sp. TaxID=1945593 RepID=UPI0028B00909|nr:zf-HC2 domain-containing protein [Oscillibacter sp.]
MNTFDSGGHLTDAALQAFLSGGPLTELERLEIAEHLDFCDACLLRSMERMPCEVLLTPAHSCQRTLWPRIHRRSARELAGRIATAAAAIAIAASLWCFNVFGGLVTGSAALSDSALSALRQADFPQQAQQFDRTLDARFARLSALFEFGEEAAD